MHAKLTNNILIPAPRKLMLADTTVYNPTDAQLEAAGYKPVRHTDPPEEPEGYYAEPRYTETAEEIVQAWELVELPPEEEPPEAWDVEQGEFIPAGTVITKKGISYRATKDHYAAWTKQPPNEEYWEVAE